MGAQSVLFIGGTGSSAQPARARRWPGGGRSRCSTAARAPPTRPLRVSRCCTPTSVTPRRCGLRSVTASSTWSRTSCRSRPSTSSSSSTSSPAGRASTSSSARPRPTRPRRRRLPVTESTPLRNPYWAYSRDKIACEDLLVRAYRDDGLPMTIVRPSHTYDHTLPPFHGGWTVVERMRRGQEVVVHGDGTSLWTITHHEDFARAFVGLLGRHDRARRGVPHHLRRGPHLEPHLRRPGRGRRGRAAAGARPVRGHRRRGRRLRGLPARRQGQLHGVRQQQDPLARPRLARQSALPRRAPRRSSTGTTPTPRVAGSTTGSTRCTTGSSRATARTAR